MKFRLVAVCFLWLSQPGRLRSAEADAQFTNSPLTNQLLQDGHFLPHGAGRHHVHDFLPPLPQDPLLFDPLVNDPFHPIAPNSLAAASAAHAATHGLPVGPSIHAVISHGSCRFICSILDLLVFSPDFSTLISLVKIAGLVETLSLPGPMTIFAPTNAAFEKLPPHRFQALLADPESLRAVLLRMVTAGRLESSDLPEGPSTLITGAGEHVTIASLPLGVTLIGPFGSANVIDADVAASNGVIHVVDSIF